PPPVTPKPAAQPSPAPPPPAPLSIPQTNVELPSPQPVDPAALLTEAPQPAEEPAPAAPPRSRRAGPPVSQPVTSAPPAATPAAEPPRPAVQEIVSQAEKDRLHEQVQGRLREVRQILDQLAKRQPDAQKDLVATIRSFMSLSEEAENHNDPRQA